MIFYHPKLSHKIIRIRVIPNQKGVTSMIALPIRSIDLLRADYPDLDRHVLCGTLVRDQTGDELYGKGD